MERRPRNVSRPECVTVPLKQLEHTRHQDAEPVFRLIRAYTELTEDTQVSLGVAYAEIVQNVEDHARSPIGAVSCARYLTGREEVRVAVVDLGEGIRATLARKHPDTLDARQALARVLDGGWSAQSRPNNFGRGLSNIRLSVTALGGELFIVSETASALMAGRRAPRFGTLPFRFPGTCVFFTLPTSGSGTL